MIKINIGSDFDPKEVIVDENKTVRAVYAESGLSLTESSIVCHNTVRLGARDVDATLVSLGVTSGDLLTMSQKLNSAK